MGQQPVRWLLALRLALMKGRRPRGWLVVTVLVGLIAPGPGSTIERTLVTVSGIALGADIAVDYKNEPVAKALTAATPATHVSGSDTV